MEDNLEEIEGTCQYFIDSTKNYFSHITKVEATTSLPFLKRSETLELKEYTGMIGISGNHKGFVYISGNEVMFAELWKYLTGDVAKGEDILDMAGEVSNVISGNVREKLGKDFMISIPMVFKGKPDRLKLPQDIPVYVIPFQWKDHEGYVVVGVSEA